MQWGKSICAIGLVIAALTAVTSAGAATPTLSHREMPADAANPAADPLFKDPYIDIDEWRDAPVRHRYVHGGFKDTDTRFSFYLPPPEKYEGRFFQHITPVPDSENLAQRPPQFPEDDKLSFAIASGAIFVENNGGGSAYLRQVGQDGTVSGYRAQVATARYARVVAQQMYGAHRTYGYAYGGSGGGYRTVSGFENSPGTWDGVVPYVLASPMAIPNMFSVRMHAMRILKDKFDQIVDALEPGGSGDMYAGLNDEERAALMEVTRMGFQPRSWFAHRTMGVHAFTAVYGRLVYADPSYFVDFWTKPGYLGFNPPESLKAARLQYPSTVKALVDPDAAATRGLEIGRIPGTARGLVDTAWQAVMHDGSKRPVAIQLNSAPPDVGFLGGDLLIKSGEANGSRVELKAIQGDTLILGITDATVLAKLKPGDQVQVDNSNFLAAQTYHRHQVPTRDYKPWDQFRGPDGQPLYPQRPSLMGPAAVTATAGSVQSGRFQGKMILVESLWDREALPWQADWYRSKVKENLGAKTDANFRLWYTDRALHADEAKQQDPSRTVQYVGILQQALRDLSRWVEKGTAPPATTNYRYDDGQIILPATARERRGVQPVVTLKVNGDVKAEVAVGQKVDLVGTIDVPPSTGFVVRAAWDFDSEDNFAEITPLEGDVHKRQHATVRTSHTYTKPGTYFPTLRGTAQREGEELSPFGRIPNLGRVRVVVK
jgi:hypothetical protein